MANTILIKGKTTTGAPSLGQLQIRELCFVIPDNAFYFKKDASTIVGPFTVNTGGGGDMLKSAYDTNNSGVVDDSERLGGTPAANFALLSSPAFTGVPTAPTAAGGTNNTQIATTAFVASAIAALVAAAPGQLDTLTELANALGNDANFASTITAALATKLDANSTIDGGTF